MTVDVGKEFHDRLANRDKYQGDGLFTADDFRQRFLKAFDNQEEWRSGTQSVILDFSNVRKIGPSFANEAFAYFMKYTTPEGFLSRTKFINISKVQRAIIEEELQAGYSR
jgi:hypothetical protein